MKTTPAPETRRIRRPLPVGRSIDGISAVLLPFEADGRPDWRAFTSLVERTYAAGLTPAVNMDTGHVGLLAPEERARALAIAREVAAGRRFVAGTFVEDQSGDPVALYRRAIETITAQGGTPILFQSSALAGLEGRSLVAAYRRIAEAADSLLAFELGTMFAPFGRIYSNDIVAALMEIPSIRGLKHSSLDRAIEWERLELRDRVRPEFKIYTGNDLAIDMVLDGSDYLLGLSAFSVEGFAARDRLWTAGDLSGHRINDLLQYLGQFAFRPPVPAYRHSAAQFLHLRGAIPSSETHPRADRRPASDLPILADISARLDRALADAGRALAGPA